ncbi:MAG: DUF4443 domain-containing protein [Nitrososphaerales archaeon]
MQTKPLNSLKTLLELLEKPIGPKPTFEVVDILKLIFLLGEDTPIGRKKIARILQLGEGSVRTMLNRLQERSLIKVERSGCKLTDAGKLIHRSLLKMLTPPKPIDAGPLSQGKWNYVVLIRDSASKVKSGLEQRDAAVRAGADGATTIVYLGKRFLLPDTRIDLEKSYLIPLWDSLKSLLEPRDGDSIIIVGGNSVKAAEEGALAAALYTILQSNHFRQKT